jgi:hypothetical protein
VCAVRVLKLLKRAAGNPYHTMPASAVGTYAQVLAVGLQRGNAMVAMKGAVESRAASAAHKGGSGNAGR